MDCGDKADEQDRRLLRCWISASLIGFVQSERRNTAQGSLHSGNLPSAKPLGCYRDTSCTRTSCTAQVRQQYQSLAGFDYVVAVAAVELGGPGWAHSYRRHTLYMGIADRSARIIPRPRAANL